MNESKPKLLKKIYLYFKGIAIWNAKMSEHLKIRIISEPEKKEEIQLDEEDELFALKKQGTEHNMRNLNQIEVICIKDTVISGIFKLTKKETELTLKKNAIYKGFEDNDEFTLFFDDCSHDEIFVTISLEDALTYFLAIEAYSIIGNGKTNFDIQEIKF